MQEKTPGLQSLHTFVT